MEAPHENACLKRNTHPSEMCGPGVLACWLHLYNVINTQRRSVSAGTLF